MKKPVELQEKIFCGSYGCVYVIDRSRVVKLFDSKTACEKEATNNKIAMDAIPKNMLRSVTLLLRESSKCQSMQVKSTRSVRTRHGIVYRRGVMDLWKYLYFSDGLRSYRALCGSLASSIVQIVELLEVFHARGMYHRDLKPDNLMVVGKGKRMRLSVVDFGSFSNNAARNAEILDGTPGFISPSYLRYFYGTPNIWTRDNFLPSDIRMLQALHGTQDIRELNWGLPQTSPSQLFIANDLWALGMTLLIILDRSLTFARTKGHAEVPAVLLLISQCAHDLLFGDMRSIPDVKKAFWWPLLATKDDRNVPIHILPPLGTEAMVVSPPTPQIRVSRVGT